MKRILYKSKIHRAQITQAELYYEGSLTVDRELMDSADILPFEKVQVVNVNNGNRFETYVIEGQPGSGTICLNGAAARLGQIGDEVIIITYAEYSEEEAREHVPTTVLVGEENKVKSITTSRLSPALENPLM
jgi:aspartate 1-decarboxylase